MTEPRHDQVRAAADDVVRTLREKRFTAYLAGGCVRDELLGLDPTDFDVATDARPEQVQSLFPRTAAVGAAFGVILVRSRGVTTEVATFRSDADYTDRRRPDAVVFSGPEEDARRRDFTINALFLDPLEPDADRAVIDFVGGRADLDAGVVRAVGDPEARLAEDHLRALRAVRFARRLGFSLDPATARASTGHAGELEGVSRERIGDEVRKMLSSPSRAGAAADLQRLGLDRPVLGEANPHAELRVLGSLPDDAAYATALAAWAIDRGLDPSRPGARAALVPAWRRALCLTNNERDALRGTLACLSDMLTRWAHAGVAERKRSAASRDFPAALDVCRGFGPSQAERIAADIEDLKRTGPGLAPPPLVNGDVLVRAGLRPGPAIGKILDATYDAQLEGRVTTEEQAIRHAMELAAELGVKPEG